MSRVVYIGSLYTDESKEYDNLEIDEFSKGFLDGIVASQTEVFGYNLTRDSLSPNIIDSINIEVSTIERLVAMKAANIDVANSLSALSNVFSIDVYTDSSLNDDMAGLSNILFHPLSDSKEIDYSKYDLAIDYIPKYDDCVINTFDKFDKDSIEILVNYDIRIEPSPTVYLYTSIKDMITTAVYLLSDKESINDTVNRYIRLGKIKELREYLASIGKELINEPDASHIFFLTQLYDIEKSSGEKTLFDDADNMEDVFKKINPLRRMIRKMEWIEECPKDEVLLYMTDNGISMAALEWVINSCCVNQDIVWRKFKV